MKTRGSILFLSLFSLSANALPVDSLQPQKTFSPVSDVRLGGGFLHNSSLPISGLCLKKMPNIISSLKKNIKFTHAIDTNDLANTLNLNLKAKAGWSKFSACAAMNYINDIKNDDYTIGFSYQSTMSADVGLDISEYYGVNALNSGAEGAYTLSEDNFIRRCGDSYIQRLNLGAVLDVSMLIRFSSQEQKKQFEASIKGKVGNIFSASAALKDEIQNARYNATISVVAFQGGGNPTYLDRIFGSDTEHHVVKCDLKNLDECTKVLDDIINYAQANGEWSNNGFANQVKLKDGQLEAESLYPINLSEATISSYENDFGLSIHRVVPSQETLSARERLNTLYEDNDKKTFFANAVLHSAAFSYLSKTVQDKLQSEGTNLNHNLSGFQDSQIMDCFLPSTQNNCSVILKKLESSLIPINNDYFNLLKGAYFVKTSYNWPSVFVRKDDGDMEMYTTNLALISPESSSTTIHDLRLTPSTDWSYISPYGGYSTYYNGVQTRYYIGYYGAEDFVYQNSNGIGYFGVIPWNTCVNGNCSKVPTAMEIIPF